MINTAHRALNTDKKKEIQQQILFYPLQNINFIKYRGTTKNT